MSKINVEIRIPIKRKREEIFSFVSNFSNHRLLYRGNIESGQVSEGPVGVGTTMKNVARFLWIDMEENFIVKKFEPNRIISKASLPGSTFVTTDTITLDDHPEGTLVTFHCYAELKGGLKLIKFLIERKFRDAVNKDWQYIKENFESGNFR